MAVLLLQKADALDKSNKTAEAIDVYLLITSAYTTSDVVGMRGISLAAFIR